MARHLLVYALVFLVVAALADADLSKDEERHRKYGSLMSEERPGLRMPKEENEELQSNMVDLGLRHPRPDDEVNQSAEDEELSDVHMLLEKASSNMGLPGPDDEIIQLLRSSKDDELMPALERDAEKDKPYNKILQLSEDEVMGNVLVHKLDSDAQKGMQPILHPQEKETENRMKRAARKSSPKKKATKKPSPKKKALKKSSPKKKALKKALKRVKA